MEIRSCKEFKEFKEFRTIACGKFSHAEICLELPELPVSLSPCILVSLKN